MPNQAAAPPYGGPAAYGAPNAGMPGYGGAPDAYGMSPAYGQGQAAAMGGSPPMPGYGQPAAAQPMMPYGQGMAGPAAQAGAISLGMAAGSGPTRRNALVTWLVPAIIIFGSMVAGVLLSILLGLISPALGLIGSLVSLIGLAAGSVLYLLSAIRMIGEVNTVTGNTSFPWWPMLVPFYGLYWAWILVPAEVVQAKQRLGVQAPTRSIVLYIFLWHFALASDINDLVR